MRQILDAAAYNKALKLRGPELDSSAISAILNSDIETVLSAAPLFFEDWALVTEIMICMLCLASFSGVLVVFNLVPTFGKHAVKTRSYSWLNFFHSGDENHFTHSQEWPHRSHRVARLCCKSCFLPFQCFGANERHKNVGLGVRSVHGNEATPRGRDSRFNASPTS